MLRLKRLWLFLAFHHCVQYGLRVQCNAELLKQLEEKLQRLPVTEEQRALVKLLMEGLEKSYLLELNELDDQTLKIMVESRWQRESTVWTDHCPAWG